MKQLIAVVAAVWLLPAAPAFPQSPRPAGAAIDYDAVRATKIVKAIRITDEITIDGALEEAAWRLASPATDFIQFTPDPGQASPERTEVRFLYDDDNLYVAFHSWDSDMAHRTVTELREDFSPTNSDVATIVIDSLHDRQNGYQFATNAAGAKRDAQISNDGQYNNDWDGVWDVKVTLQEDGWIAEFVIPFTTFRFSNEPTQEWGLNLGRKILRRNEDSQWSPIPIRSPTLSTARRGALPEPAWAGSISTNRTALPNSTSTKFSKARRIMPRRTPAAATPGRLCIGSTMRFGTRKRRGRN